MRIKAYDLLENYTPGTDDRLLVETSSGTKTILSSQAINPYTKTQIDNLLAAKQPVQGAAKHSAPDGSSADTYTDLDTRYDIWLNLLNTSNNGDYDYTDFINIGRSGLFPIGQLGISRTGRIRFRKKDSSEGSWGSWGQVGTTDNIADGAITTPKLATDVQNVFNSKVTFYDTIAEGATPLEQCIDQDKIYKGFVNGSGNSNYGTVFSITTGGGGYYTTQFGFDASGRIMSRIINNISHTADNWSPIGTTINIADGAITLPKLNSAVYSTETIDEYIVEGNQSDNYKATGVCQKIAGLCTLVVKAKCTSSNTMNSFTLPSQFHANTDYNFYTDVSIWPAAQVPAKEYSIKISGDTCYIRTKDDSSLGRATVYFSITYIPSVS